MNENTVSFEFRCHIMDRITINVIVMQTINAQIT